MKFASRPKAYYPLSCTAFTYCNKCFEAFSKTTNKTVLDAATFGRIVASVWMKQQREWLTEQLSTRFGLEQVDELVEYLLQCEDETVLKEYLGGLLGKGEQTDALLQELFGKNNHWNKQEPETNAFPDGNNKLLKDDRKVVKEKGHKGSKFSSKKKLSSEKNDNSNKPYMRNCLCCGKVIMEYASKCDFCGWSPEEDAERYGKELWGETWREAVLSCTRSKRNPRLFANGNEVSKQEDEDVSELSDSDEELDEIDYEILSKKERLLEMERNPRERLQVFDENRDYFDVSSYHLLDEVQKKEWIERNNEQLRIAKERKESVKTTFDIEGKLVYQVDRSDRPSFNPFLPGPPPTFIATSTSEQPKQS